MFWLKSDCKICGMPTLSVRVCAGKGHHFFIMCDECDVVWKTPELMDEPYFPETNDFLCPSCEDTLSSPTAYWATKEQIVKLGWWEYILNPPTD